MNYYKIRKQLQDTKQFDYVQLPSKVAQETIRVLDKNFKSFFKAINEYKKNPSKFTGRPKLPHYLDKDNGRFILIFTNQAFSKKVLEKTHQIKVSGLENPICSTELSYKDINQVRIVRENDTYVVELVYTVDTMDLKEDNGRYAGIDLGLNNLITVVSNVDGYVPFAVSGKPLKAMNQYYNKKLSESRSILETRNKKKSSRYTKRLTNKRNNKVNDYLHKTSRYLVNQLVSSNITKVVIGYNKGWKQDINIGHKNNQNFVQIPYRKLVDMIIYKCRLVGIEVIEQNESYSSKCSFLDGEPVKKHKIYVGKRIVRGK